ncbi:cuticle protein CP14.6-like [Halyomorpha halys]|uniref:cuticle protein CP14.6-like n=1 Tax=Halyomorpha halys TaxID=286706 RepID=UPI0006D4C6EF|nr:cuticle protein CP14.6-like [Halyomorpha halys]
MTVIWSVLILGVALAQCQKTPNNDVILSSINENNHDGSYKYSYQTSNGISVEEEGSLKNRGTEGEAQTSRGRYSYTAPDGQVITVNWYADETGFHAESAHIPGSGASPIQPTAVSRPSDIPRHPIIPRLTDLSTPGLYINVLETIRASPEFFRG